MFVKKIDTNMTTHESTKKKYSSYNQVAIRILREKYGISRNYVVKSITGDRVGTFCDTIKKEYYELKAKEEKAQEEFVNSNK